MRNDKVNKIEIRGTLANLDPIITEVATELHFESCDFDVRSVNSKRTDTFALFDVFIIEGAPNPNKKPIGAFTLKVPENNRVILRVPLASQRTWGHLSAQEQIQIGLQGSKYDKHLNTFVSSLDERLTEYGLKITWYKKLWYELKDFTATIIAKFAAEKTK